MAVRLLRAASIFQLRNRLWPVILNVRGVIRNLRTVILKLRTVTLATTVNLRTVILSGVRRQSAEPSRRTPTSLVARRPPNSFRSGWPAALPFVVASRYPEASASGLLAAVKRKGALAPGVCLALALLTGCHHKPQIARQPAPPPSRRPEPATPRPTPTPPSLDDTTGPPIYTETGLASWYGPSFHGRAAADGSAYDQDGLTAAHRTLPMGSTVRVTNLATGQEVYVRITDRGPFVRGRILDLSMGAAKAVGLYRMGVGRVRIEAFAHHSADPPGHWCVQTGAFTTENDARDLKTALLERYRGSKVAEFEGPTGYWVRIDPVTHSRTDALEIQDWIGSPDPHAVPYLVRID